MDGVGRHDALQGGEDPRRVGARRAVAVPVVPGAQVHQRFGVERRDLQVVGEARGHGADGGAPGGVERTPVGGRHFGVARGQRVDEGAFAVAGPSGARLRLADSRPRRRAGGRIHGRVDVGAEGKRHAPAAHGAGGIAAAGLLEGADRLGVVEGVVEPESLVEVALDGGIGGGDAVVVRAEVVVQGDGWGLGGRAAGGREQQAGGAEEPRHGGGPGGGWGAATDDGREGAAAGLWADPEHTPPAPPLTAAAAAARSRGRRAAPP